MLRNSVLFDLIAKYLLADIFAVQHAVTFMRLLTSVARCLKILVAMTSGHENCGVAGSMARVR
jgi:hypothetical protein